jgi:hypothetical protein
MERCIFAYLVDRPSFVIHDPKKADPFRVHYESWRDLVPANRRRHGQPIRNPFRQGHANAFFLTPRHVFPVPDAVQEAMWLMLLINFNGPTLSVDDYVPIMRQPYLYRELFQRRHATPLHPHYLALLPYKERFDQLPPPCVHCKTRCERRLWTTSLHLMQDYWSCPRRTCPMFQQCQRD